MEEQRDGQDVLVWKQDQQVDGPVSITTPFLFGVSIGGRGTCHVIATLKDDRVSRIAYTGPSTTLNGPLAACAPLISECEAFARKAAVPVKKESGAPDARPE